MTAIVLPGDCRKIIAGLADQSIDAIVTDPPYELGFMGKRWDASGIAYDVDLWAECLRVLKPGGHLLAFGGTRTYHRMTVAIEDAGFEIRDSIHWLYGSGFPKSLNVSKAIDKAAGMLDHESVGFTVAGRTDKNLPNPIVKGYVPPAPATDAARQWEGWGTALKPAHEPIVVARKPLAGTVAANVLEHGTGALNIDGCRVGSEGGTTKGNPPKGKSNGIYGDGINGACDIVPLNAGRWPANLLIDDVIAGRHPEWGHYFYTAKPSRRERNAGLEGLPTKTAGEVTDRKDGSAGLNSPRAGAGRTSGASNHHPTVKPLALMRWLVRLVTPPGGTVLDPFAGSGTTLAAAILEGFDAIGCELTDDYLPIIDGRIAWAEAERAKTIPTLFGGAA